ncbi:hypothetical protein ACM64Y_06480 [Novispirillum sp. DQ9]|uniref:hypothetical protein n=1 Tax=Novispirillum sp. DQ9 TaxID=3398612 RepID=UPI003C7DE8AE
MSEVIFHIGTGKTGTSSIQAFLYDNAGELAKVGVRYAQAGMYHPGKAQHLLSHKWGGWLSRHLPKGLDFDGFWRSLREEIEARPGRYIVSSERFTGLSVSRFGPQCIRYIRDALPGVEIKVIAYLRRQDDFLESVYKQGVKAGHIHVTPTDYLAEIPPYFAYDAVLAPWAEMFGEDAVSARVYDRKRFLNGDLLQDFFDACRIPWADGLVLPEAEANPSISDLSARLIIDLDLKTATGGPMLKRQVRAAFDSHPVKTGLFLAQTKHELMERCAPGNRAVAARFIRTPAALEAFAPRPPRAQDLVSFDDQEIAWSYLQTFARLLLKVYGTRLLARAEGEAGAQQALAVILAQVPDDQRPAVDAIFAGLDTDAERPPMRYDGVLRGVRSFMAAAERVLAAPQGTG